jgi:hypothetical protein
MNIAPRGLVSLLSGFTFVGFLAFSNSHALAGDESPRSLLAPSLQNPAPRAPAESSSQDQASQSQKQANKNDRVFFVMPNYLTVANESKAEPLRWRQKFAITAKGVFDPYEFAVVGILAGIRQAENAYPAFGQGVAGYGRRYGTALADQVDGNMMVGAVFPTILKTDPRYFQLGQGGFLRRFGYAISRVFVTRKDSGGSTVNFSEPVGNGAAIAISNLYYPPADRGFSSSLHDWGVQMGIDALGNELKEFWPDIHRRLAHKKKVTSSESPSGLTSTKRHEDRPKCGR